MNCSCLKCQYIIEDIDFGHISLDYIECPNCGNKMTVEFDDGYNEETNEECHSWWLSQYIE